VNITGSTLPVLRRCQWWARPEVIAPPPTPPTDAMQLGSEIHAAIEASIIGSEVHVSAEAREAMRTWMEWWKTAPLGAYLWQAEVAYSYDPATDTATKLGSSMARKYEVAPGCIAGTIDALALTDDGAIIVDWKTGNDFGHHVADAEHNWQLKMYALAVSRAHGVGNVTVAIVRIGDEVRTTTHTLDALDLDVVASEVQALVKAVPTSSPTPGLHCRRCRVVAICPATAVATTAIAPAEPVKLEITSKDQAAALLVRLRQVQAACEQMEAALKIYAINNDGIPLAGGKRWVKTSVDRESISLSGQDMAMGVGLICEAGCEDALESKTTTSKAALERSLKAKGLKGKELREKMDGLMSELRAAGVVRVASVDAWREVE